MSGSRAARSRRSVLAVPGSNSRMMEKAAASAADSVFLDLEDACAPAEKPAARGKVVDALRTHDWNGKVLAVRINEVGSQLASSDIDTIVRGAGAILDCIIVPKVRDISEVAIVDAALESLETQLGLAHGGIGVEVQIEDAEGLVNCEAIAMASERVKTLIFGPADFSASMQFPSLSVGGNSDYPGDLFYYPRFRLAVAARAAGVQVIDGPYLRIRDIDGLRAEAQRSAAMGFDGKWVVHPDQIAPCNEAFTPSQADFDKAHAILEAYQHATDIEGTGALMLDDEMIDAASRKMAAQFVMRGEAAGLKAAAMR